MPNGRVNGERDRLEKLETKVDKHHEYTLTHFVSKETFALELRNIADRYDPFRAALNKLMWVIVLAFAGALAQIVYQHGK